MSSQLLDIIQKKTLQAAISKNYHNLDTDALTLSIDMNYNRSNISRSLNNLNRGGFLVKVHGRPTYYLDKKTICDFYDLTQIPLELDNLEQLRLLFLTEGRSIARIPIMAFDSLIGSGNNESLQPAINSAMKIALYPGNIHAYLITGQVGTGKQSFCQTIFNMEEELRSPDTTAPAPLWIDLHSPGAEHALESLSMDHLEPNACIGFLHVDQAAPELVSKLVAWCNALAFQNPDTALSYAILSENSDFSESLLHDLYPAPAAIFIPCLDQRSIKERILFILSAFQKQCDLLRLPITLDRPSFQSFVVTNYKQNLRTMNNAVRQACQNSYFRCYPCSGTLPVTLSDIPDAVFNDTMDVQDILPAIRDLESRVSLNLFKFLPQKSNPTSVQLRDWAIGPDGRLLTSSTSLFKAPPCATLYLQCEQDLKNTRAAYQLSQDSKMFQLLLRILMPLLPEDNASAPHALYYGMLQHLSDVINQLLTKSYHPDFSPVEEITASDLSSNTRQLTQAIQSQFDVALPLVEQQYIHIYLEDAVKNRHLARVKIAVLCHWSEIITVYQRFASSLLYENQPEFFSYKKSSVGRERELQLRHILDGLSELQEGGGLIIISDGTPDEDFVKMIYEEIGRNVLFISHLSQEIIRKALMFFDDPLATLEEFGRILSNSDSSHFMVESRITIRIKALINDTLVFLDANKVYNALSDALNAILNRMDLPYNDSLAIRFIVHSSFTIERSIRRESLPYKRADEYLRQHKGLSQIIKSCLEPIQNLFNIQISNAELAYLVEIFSDYV